MMHLTEVFFPPLEAPDPVLPGMSPHFPAAAIFVLHVKALMHVVTSSLTGRSEQQDISRGQVLGE